MERLRTSIMLLLIVVGVLLRADALIVLYTRRRTVPLLEGMMLSVFSPIMAMIAFNFTSKELWDRIREKDNAAKAVLAILGLLFASQIAASWNYLQILFALDMTLGRDRFFGPGSQQQSFGPEMILLMICLYVMILIPLLVIHMGRWRVRCFFKGKGQTFTTVAIGAGAMILIQVGTAAIYSIVRGSGGPVSSSLFMAPIGIGEYTILIIAVALIAPLIEEMIFRGAVYLAVSKKLGRTWAVGISALLFALAHMDPLTMVPLFGLGVILGWARSRSGSILPSYVMHSANNLAAILWM